MDSNEFYNRGAHTTDRELAAKYSTPSLDQQSQTPSELPELPELPSPPKAPIALPPASRPAKFSKLKLPIKILICVFLLFLIGFGLALTTFYLGVR